MLVRMFAVLCMNVSCEFGKNQPIIEYNSKNSDVPHLTWTPLAEIQPLAKREFSRVEIGGGKRERVAS